MLVRTHTASFWPIFWLALFAGIVSSFDVPVRQSLLFDLVGPEDIINATALNSVIFNVARIVGPTIAALIIVRSGEAVNFFANALSFLFVVWALWSIRIGPGAAAARAARRSEPLRRQIAYGVGLCLCAPLLARMFAALFVFSVFGFNYILLMPVFAKFVLHGGAHALGILMTCLGVGALLGSLSMAGRARTSLRSLVVTGLLVPGIACRLRLHAHVVDRFASPSAPSDFAWSNSPCVSPRCCKWNPAPTCAAGFSGCTIPWWSGSRHWGRCWPAPSRKRMGPASALAAWAPSFASVAVIVAVAWPRDQPDTRHGHVRRVRATSRRKDHCRCFVSV